MEPRRRAQFLQEAAGIMGLDAFEQQRILLFDIRDQLLDPVLQSSKIFRFFGGFF